MKPPGFSDWISRKKITGIPERGNDEAGHIKIEEGGNGDDIGKKEVIEQNLNMGRLCCITNNH